MSLSDCEKCWDTPCTCGWDYRNWTKKEIKDQIKMLQKALKNVKQTKNKLNIVKRIKQSLKNGEIK